MKGRRQSTTFIHKSLTPYSRSSSQEPATIQDQDWEDLCTLIEQATLALTTKRHRLVSQALSSPAFRWFLAHYSELSSFQILRLYQLIVNSKSPELFKPLSQRLHFILHLSKILDPSEAANHLFPLLQLVSNIKGQAAAISACIQFLVSWSTSPNFDGEETFRSLYEQMKSASLAPSSQAIQLAHLKKLQEQFQNTKKKTCVDTTVPGEEACDTEIGLFTEPTLIPSPPQEPLYYDGIFKKPESQDAMLPMEDLREQEFRLLHRS